MRYIHVFRRMEFSSRVLPYMLQFYKILNLKCYNGLWRSLNVTKQLCKLTDIIMHRTFCDMYTVTALPSCKFSRKHFCSGCRRGTVPATLKCWTVRQFRHDSYSNYSTGVVSLSLLRAVLLMLAELTKTSLFTSRFRVSTRWTKKWGHKLMAIVLSNLNRFT